MSKSVLRRVIICEIQGKTQAIYQLLSPGAVSSMPSGRGQVRRCNDRAAGRPDPAPGRWAELHRAALLSAHRRRLRAGRGVPRGTRGRGCAGGAGTGRGGCCGLMLTLSFGMSKTEMRTAISMIHRFGCWRSRHLACSSIRTIIWPLWKPGELLGHSARLFYLTGPVSRPAG